MKIVYFLHSTFNSGGMERIVIEKANWLSRTGHQVYIITTEQNGRSNFFQLEKRVERIDLDIMYSELNTYSFLKKLIPYQYKIKLHKRKLNAILNQINPDISISTFGSEIYLLPSIPHTGKNILEIHFSKSFRKESNRKGWFYLIDRIKSFKDEIIISKYDKFIVLTKEDKKLWGNKDNIVCISNFVKIDNLSFEKEKKENKRCLAVGRLDYQKNYTLMIHAWKLVNQFHPDWKLDIFGDGPEKEMLQKLIIENDLNEVIQINTPVSNIKEQYLNSDFLLLTSRYEGLPMVLLEAMSNGLPVISVACKCGPRDVIENKFNGLLIESYNPIDIANSIIFIIENTNERIRMGENAFQTVKSKYNSQIIMSQWYKLLSELNN